MNTLPQVSNFSLYYDANEPTFYQAPRVAAVLASAWCASHPGCDERLLMLQIEGAYLEWCLDTGRYVSRVRVLP